MKQKIKKTGSHKMPNGMMMKDSEMKKMTGKKKAKKGKKKYANA